MLYYGHWPSKCLEKSKVGKNILDILLVSELDIDSKETNSQDDPKGSGDAQGHIDGDVDSVRDDAFDGPVLRRSFSNPINFTAPLQIQSTGDTAVFSDTLLFDACSCGLW